MHRRTCGLLVTAGAIAGAGLWLWLWWSALAPPEREIRGRLKQFVSAANAPGGLTRSAHLAEFFTEDIVVELGAGTQAIHGRDTLMGMAIRLQPRTDAYVLEVEDVSVDVLEDARAMVRMTLVVRQRRRAPGEASLDARELSVEMRNTDGVWRGSRVVAVEAFR